MVKAKPCVYFGQTEKKKKDSNNAHKDSVLMNTSIQVTTLCTREKEKKKKKEGRDKKKQKKALTSKDVKKVN